MGAFPGNRYQLSLFLGARSTSQYMVDAMNKTAHTMTSLCVAPPSAESYRIEMPPGRVVRRDF